MSVQEKEKPSPTIVKQKRTKKSPAVTAPVVETPKGKVGKRLCYKKKTL